MDRKHAVPSVASPGNAGPDPVTGPVTGAVTPLPETPAVSGNTRASVAVVPVTMPERVAEAVKRGHAATLNAVHELWLRPGRLLYVMWHGKPESLSEHRAYMKSRAWVPPGMDGGAEKAVTGAGLFYHLLIGRPLLAAANTVAAAAVRPLRLLCLAVLVVALLVIFTLL